MLATTAYQHAYTHQAHDAPAVQPSYPNPEQTAANILIPEKYQDTDHYERADQDETRSEQPEQLAQTVQHEQTQHE
jgi:hypothetical protein